MFADKKTTDFLHIRFHSKTAELSGILTPRRRIERNVEI